MITILYSILIYIFLGGIVYLIAQQQSDKELTYPKMIFFYITNYIFLPIIKAIEFIENYKIILEATKRYNEILKNKDLTSEERQTIINQKDEIIDFLSNLSDEVDYDEE